MSIGIYSSHGRGQRNPYIDLFYDALSHYGFELLGEFSPSVNWLKDNSDSIEVLHFHWPEYIFRQPGKHKTERSNFNRNLYRLVPGAWRIYAWADRIQSSSFFKESAKRIRRIRILVSFAFFLTATKRRGIRLIWTVHNIRPHEDFFLIEKIGFWLLSHSAHLLIFHTKTAKEEFSNRYRPKGELVVMPHGNYLGVYPKPRHRGDILTSLGASQDLPVVSLIGELRLYKGVETACEAAVALKGSVTFLCAGSPNRIDVKNFQTRFQQIPNAILVPRFLSEQEFSDFASVSDAFLLPYHRVTGSGVLLAALSLKCGVIASDLPFFREILGDAPMAGMLFPAKDSVALAKAISEYLEIPKDKRQLAVSDLCEKYDWRKTVLPVVKILNTWGEGEENEL